MRTKGLRLALVLMLFLQLTGCVAHTDIDNLNFVLGAAFDYDVKSKQYEVFVQVPSPKTFSKVGGGGQPQEKYRMLSGKGETVFDAIRNIAVGNRILFWGHCKVFVASQELAKNGIFELMDFLIRDNEIREDAYFLVSKVPLKELLTVQGEENVPLFTIPDLIENSLPVHGEGLQVRVRDVTNDILNPKSTYLVSLIGMKEQAVKTKEAPKSYVLTGAAVLKGDRLMALLTPEETWSYNLLRNKLDDTLVTVRFQSSHLVVEQISSNTKLKPQVKGSEVTLAIQTRIRGNVGDVGKPINLEQHNTIKAIQKVYEQKVKERITRSLKQAQSRKLDYFGIGREIEKADPKYWASIKDNWEEALFPDLPIEFKVEGTILRTGLTITMTPEDRYGKGKSD